MKNCNYTTVKHVRVTLRAASRFAVDQMDEMTKGTSVGDQQLQDVAPEDVEAARIGVLVGHAGRIIKDE